MLPGQIVHARNKTKSSVDNFPLDVATLKIKRTAQYRLKASVSQPDHSSPDRVLSLGTGGF